MSDDDDGTPFSRQQLAALRACRTFAATLSVLGSGLIICHVVWRRKRQGGSNSAPKNRLLVGLSASDLLFSLENALLAPTVYPVLQPGPLCSFDGFVHTAGNMAAYYNASLAFYFLAVIRWNMSDQAFERRFEIFCHLVPLAVGLTAASTAVGLDLYNPKSTGMGCWIEDYPLGCTTATDHDDDGAGECRGDATLMKVYPHVAQTFPMLVALAVMTTCNVLIFRFVRRLEQRNVSYVFGHNHNRTTTSSSTTANPDDGQRSSPGRMSLVWVQSLRRSTLGNDDDPNDNNPPENATADTPSNMYAKSRKIAVQSYFYIAAFFITYLPGVCFLIAGAILGQGQDDERLFPLQVISSLLFPAQGFWNALVYLRPQYLAWREASQGRWHALVLAVKLVPPPSPKQRRRTIVHQQQQQQHPHQGQTSDEMAEGPPVNDSTAVESGNIPPQRKDPTERTAVVRLTNNHQVDINDDEMEGLDPA